MGCGILYRMVAEQIGLCAMLATRRTDHLSVCVCVFLASGYDWATVRHEIPISSAQPFDILPYPRTQ